MLFQTRTGLYREELLRRKALPCPTSARFPTKSLEGGGHSSCSTESTGQMLLMEAANLGPQTLCFLQGFKSGAESAQHPARPAFQDQSNGNFWKAGAGSPTSSSKVPWALTLFPQLHRPWCHTVSRQGLGPLSCGCTVLGYCSHSFY